MGRQKWAVLTAISGFILLTGCTQNTQAPITSIQAATIAPTPTQPVQAPSATAAPTQYGGQTTPLLQQTAIPAQTLNLAPASTVTTLPGTNQSAKAVGNQLLSQGNIVPNALNVSSTPTVTTDGVIWSWPVSGQILESFGQGGGLFAKGMQIATSQNAKVLAAADGLVKFSAVGVNGYGKMIIIKSSNNFLTAYTNLAGLLVKKGQTVKRGDPIGIVGLINAKPILHFEIRQFGNPVNPVNYLPAGS